MLTIDPSGVSMKNGNATRYALSSFKRASHYFIISISRPGTIAQQSTLDTTHTSDGWFTRKARWREAAWPLLIGGVQRSLRARTRLLPSTSCRRRRRRRRRWTAKIRKSIGVKNTDIFADTAEPNEPPNARKNDKGPRVLDSWHLNDTRR